MAAPIAPDFQSVADGISTAEAPAEAPAMATAPAAVVASAVTASAVTALATAAIPSETRRDGEDEGGSDGAAPAVALASLPAGTPFGSAPASGIPTEARSAQRVEGDAAAPADATSCVQVVPSLPTPNGDSEPSSSAGRATAVRTQPADAILPTSAPVAAAPSPAPTEVIMPLSTEAAVASLSVQSQQQVLMRAPPLLPDDRETVAAAEAFTRAREDDEIDMGEAAAYQQALLKQQQTYRELEQQDLVREMAQLKAENALLLERVVDLNEVIQDRREHRQACNQLGDELIRFMTREGAQIANIIGELVTVRHMAGQRIGHLNQLNLELGELRNRVAYTRRQPMQPGATQLPLGLALARGASRPASAQPTGTTSKLPPRPRDAPVLRAYSAGALRRKKPAAAAAGLIHGRSMAPHSTSSVRAWSRPRLAQPQEPPFPPF